MDAKQMIAILKSRLKKKTPTPQELEKEYIQRELRETKEQIELAHTHFNDTSDKDMISYYSYMIKAFEVKYNSLIRRAKEINTSS